VLKSAGVGRIEKDLGAGVLKLAGVGRIEKDLAAGVLKLAGVGRIGKDLAASGFKLAGLGRIQQDLAAGMLKSAGLGRLQRDLTAGIFKTAGLDRPFDSFDRQAEAEVAAADPEMAEPNQRIISRRELAVYVAVTVFLVAYISLSVLIRYQASAREISQVDGPNLFEAAMALGALAFWIVMNFGDKS
jgi:hypothetical protein